MKGDEPLDLAMINLFFCLCMALLMIVIAEINDNNQRPKF
jgi:hypothetical protein